MAKGVMTAIGREKLCKAHSGDIHLPKIVTMGFGNGGVDDNGAVIEPTGTETALKSELLKVEILDYKFPEKTTANYSVRLPKNCQIAGEQVSEQGLFDADGDLVAYKTFLPKGIDAEMEFVFEMQEIF